MAHAAAQAAGTRALRATPVAGGDINRALRVETADAGVLFIKHHPHAPAGMFHAEARALAWLAQAGALRVPAVVWAGDDGLALEWIEPGIPAADHDERLGAGLAALHRAGAPCFGADEDGFIATIAQSNRPTPTWARFYGERRITPLVRAAVDGGLLDHEIVPAAERLCARLPDLLGPDEPPARLHGDLWSGNATTGPAGDPVLVDPASYGGHREMDLAMMELFGGFGPRVRAAYDEAWPPAPGEAERRPLHQLHPLLVHTVLFGGGYATRARRIIVRHGGR